MTGPDRRRWAVADVRGLLAIPAGTDKAAWERAAYVGALQAANRGQGRW
jgi:hypothetical protein